MSISQAEIARQVGVSRTAVSHVLNGRTHMVSPKVREKIFDAVNTAGYHRNALVRALKANRTHVVGIIVPEEGVSYFTEIIRAAESKAQGYGLQCFLCQSHSHSDAVSKHISALREYRVDGVLIAPASSTERPEMYRALQDQKFPFVLVDSPIAGVRAPFIVTQNTVAGRLATDHLISYGHRRIACISGYSGNWSTKQRLIGYRQAMKRAGIPIDPQLMLGNSFGFEEGSSQIRHLISNRIPFTAVVTHSDISALGAIQELTRQGLRVPQDVSVVGCGNLDVSAMVTPPLTTVDQEPRTIGSLAMEMLVNLIEGKVSPSRHTIVKPQLVVRSTTAPLTTPSR